MSLCLPGSAMLRCGRTLAALVVATSMAACAAPPRKRPRPVLIAEPLPSFDGQTPGQGATDLDRGVALVQNERYADGIALIEKAFKTVTPDAESTYYLGFAYDRVGRRREAEATYQQAITLDPKLVEARMNLGAMYLEDPPQPAKALAVLEPAVAIEPRAIDVNLNLAYANRLLKRLDQAANHYRAALASQDKVETRQMLADVLYDAGKMGELVLELKKLVPAFSRNAKALAAIAGRFAKAGSYADCAVTYTKVVALDGTDASSYLNRGLCRHELKEREEDVLADYERAVEADSKFQPAHFYMAMSLMQMKKLVRAAEAFEKAYKLGPDTTVGRKAKAHWDDLIRR
ncbi:MAG: tetratricopeptide repeat protein [Deltaproteobacteria bacterium]|nr:tetratricopeptide repeat protein [Deltaproteobacteria bacterium]